VHAAVIFVEFHKLAAVVETLDIKARSDNDLVLLQSDKVNLRSDSMEKGKIVNKDKLHLITVFWSLQRKKKNRRIF